MNRIRKKRAALVFVLMLVVLIAIPIVATRRQVRQDRLNQALIAAVKRNDDQAVVTLLDRGADANARDEPLRKYSMWQTLMQMVRGRRPQPSNGPTPLLIAMMWREQATRSHVIFRGSLLYHVFVSPPENLPLLRALLDHGADVNQRDADGNTPLIWAIQGGMNASVHLLLARGASALLGNMERSNLSDVPLVRAVQSEDIDTNVIAELLDRGVNVNQRDSNGDTALSTATTSERVDVVRLLLTRHADPAVPDSDGKTPLAWAFRDDSPQGRQIVRLLKAAGARK